MAASLRQGPLDFDGSIFCCHSQILDRHRAERRSLKGASMFSCRSGGVADFQLCHRSNAHESTFDSSRPFASLDSDLQAKERRGVDEPLGQRHAEAMNSGSLASAHVSASRRKSSTVTLGARAHSRSSIRRRYSARESSALLALASTAAMTSSDTSRIRMSVTRCLHGSP